MKMVIDGQEIDVAAGTSVLEAALNNGIYIPHLCKHPDLTPSGGCKMCSIEIDHSAEAVCACKTTVSEGMNVETRSEVAEKTRKMAMELLLATHPADCTGCPKYGKCELQSLYQYMGVTPQRWKAKSRSYQNDDSNPLISHLFTRCIRCGRCVKACRELRGVKVLDFQKGKDGPRIGTDGFKPLAESGCKFCGACIEVCPTGAIMDQLSRMKDEVPYADNVVPCSAACPAHVDIPRYLRYVKAGEYSKAISVVREKVPFPETLGSICSHLCEGGCKRNDLGKPVSICKLKLTAAHKEDGSWKEHVVNHPPTNRKAAIIGGGPAGLSAAYYLSRKGHQVTVFEANEQLGGQCRYGIPAYRLPDETLDREIADILENGVEVKYNQRITKPAELLKEGFETVLVATGTHAGNKLPIEGNDLPQVYVNTDFLKRSRENQPLEIGERVMVLGGGNVAYDCARTAIRLGAKEVHLACLEARDKMVATDDEITGGAEEGVILHAGYSFLRIVGETQVEGIEIQKIDKFYFDENRKAVMELVEGSNEVIPVDTVIFAVGQRPEDTLDMDLELTHRFYLAVDKNGQTSIPNIFGAGDVVSGTNSVIAAIARGRECASAMDLQMGGDGKIDEILVAKEAPEQFIGRKEDFAKLPRLYPKEVEPNIRKKCFAMIENGFDDDAAHQEASRCLQCDLRLTIKKPKFWNEY